MTSTPHRGSIVVGLDGSPGASHALRWATHQARLERRPLTLAHGAGVHLTSSVGEPGFEVGQVWRTAELVGRRLLEEASESLAHEDVVVRRVCTLQDARELLLDLAQEAAMVVVGSRGRGPVASLLLGSVSVATLEHAACAVVVLRPEPAAVSVPHRPSRPIVVGLPSSGTPDAAVLFAFEQAAARELPLVVLRDFSERASFGDQRSPHEIDLDSLEGERAATAVTELREKFPEVSVTFRSGGGPLADCLVEAADESSMVVIGRGSSSGTFVHGDVARRVTEHVHCPVAVVPA